MYLYIWYCLTKYLANSFTDFSPTGTGYLTGTELHYNFHLDTLLCLTWFNPSRPNPRQIEKLNMNFCFQK